jgi:HD superfamily phosphohydrolase
MYSQVYFHHIRRIYDIHLKDFLQAWLPAGSFSTDVGDHLAMTDNEVTAAFLEAALDSSKRGHDSAQKIVQRQHFKVLYERNPADVAINPEAGQAIHEGLCAEFGDEYFRHDRYRQKSGAPDFPVRMRDDQIVSSLAISEALRTLPVVSVDYVFAERAMYADADKWLRQKHDQIIQPKPEEEANG